MKLLRLKEVYKEMLVMIRAFPVRMLIESVLHQLCKNILLHKVSGNITVQFVSNKHFQKLNFNIGMC